ncbi:MAG: hypothetical protein D6696_13005 [Acidobacteria bacterium]|nr:MAG: hypothetical protein D6696_13005 [Acidobacteriota bacterium]
MNRHEVEEAQVDLEIVQDGEHDFFAQPLFLSHNAEKVTVPTYASGQVFHLETSTPCETNLVIDFHGDAPVPFPDVHHCTSRKTSRRKCSWFSEMQEHDAMAGHRFAMLAMAHLEVR